MSLLLRSSLPIRAKDNSIVNNTKFTLVKQDNPKQIITASIVDIFDLAIGVIDMEATCGITE